MLILSRGCNIPLKIQKWLEEKKKFYQPCSDTYLFVYSIF